MLTEIYERFHTNFSLELLIVTVFVLNARPYSIRLVKSFQDFITLPGNHKKMGPLMLILPCEILLKIGDFRPGMTLGELYPFICRSNDRFGVNLSGINILFTPYLEYRWRFLAESPSPIIDRWLKVNSKQIIVNLLSKF